MKPYSKKKYTITMEFGSERQDECRGDIIPTMVKIMKMEIENKHKLNKITFEEKDLTKPV